MTNPNADLIARADAFRHAHAPEYVPSHNVDLWPLFNEMQSALESLVKERNKLDAYAGQQIARNLQLGDEIEALQGQVADLSGQCGDLNHRNQQLQKRVGELECGLEVTGRVTAEHVTKIAAERDALQKRVGELQEAITTYDQTRQFVKTLMAECDALRAKLAEAEQALRKCADSVKALIVKGPLPGNGLDKTAERNGLILAYNTIAAAIDGALCLSGIK